MLFFNRERQALENIRDELEARIAKAGTPQEISNFLLKRWSYLLAGVYLSHGDTHPDWTAGWQTVNALLWSLQPKRDRKEAGRLLRLLPILLERLQDGCEAMNLEPAERDGLFSQLTMMHAAIAREGLQSKPGMDGPATGWAAEADLEMSGEELADLSKDIPQVDMSETTVPEPEAAALAQIKLGDGLLLRKQDGDKKLSLKWMSPMGGMYLFTDEEGFDSVSLTKARLLDRLRNGEARLV
jgi:hypothetical protein